MSEHSQTQKIDWHIGCSGWSYKHWRGSFYPQGVPARLWFEHYASVFDTVELNGSFYRLPPEPAVRAWRNTAPESFVFAAKVSRLITHFRRLRDCEPALRTFLGRIEGLGQHLGPLLYQLPPDLERDDALLDDFLSLLPRRRRHVFEFRNRSWWADTVFDLLSRHDASFCIYDAGTTETPLVATSPLVYVRFHGPEGGYSGGYSSQALTSWARRLAAIDGAHEVYAYFNNDVGGHAPHDAQHFRDLAARIKA